MAEIHQTKLVLVEPRDTGTGRPNPKCAALINVNRADPLSRQHVLARKPRYLASGKAVQSPRGADPHIAAAILGHALNAIARQAVDHRVTPFQLTILIL